MTREASAGFSIRNRVWPGPRHLIIPACAAMALGYSLPAYGQPVATDSGPASVSSPPMSMDPAAGVTSQAPTASVSGRCPDGQTFSASMDMCMPAVPEEGGSLSFRLNQFAVYSDTSGPRGLARTTGPGLWMLMYERQLAPGNRIRVDVMGSAEQVTVGDRGTPQLLQTENIDSMHPHDTIMAVEIRDTLDLDADGRSQLTILFAPRGSASYGPVPFMHRLSAEGNPDAPLGHDSQDGLHDVSTVLGLSYRRGPTTIEMTAFSGKGVSWPLPLHESDSWAVRINQTIGEHLGLGVSFADVLVSDDLGGVEHERFAAAWLAGSHEIGGGHLYSSFVLGRHQTDGDPVSSSVLAEAVYRRGADSVYGRAETLQVARAQLDIGPPLGADEPRWVQAITVGYERRVVQRNGVTLSLGGSYTLDFVPDPFGPAYGDDPHGVKVYGRISIDTASAPGF